MYPRNNENVHDALLTIKLNSHSVSRERCVSNNKFREIPLNLKNFNYFMRFAATKHVTDLIWFTGAYLCKRITRHYITDGQLHNGHNGVSNHQPHVCLLNRLFRCISKKTSTFRVTGLCAGNSSVTGEVNSPHKGLVMRKMSPFDDVIMNQGRVRDVCVSKHGHHGRW